MGVFSSKYMLETTSGGLRNKFNIVPLFSVDYKTNRLTSQLPNVSDCIMHNMHPNDFERRKLEIVTLDQ